MDIKIFICPIILCVFRFQPTGLNIYEIYLLCKIGSFFWLFLGGIYTGRDCFVFLCPGAPEGSTGSGVSLKRSDTGPWLKVSSDRLVQPLIELAISKHKASDLSTSPRRFSVRLFPGSTACCITVHVSYNFAKTCHHILKFQQLMVFEITF